MPDDSERPITPLAFGMSRIRPARFVTLNVIGAASWTATYTAIGFGVGTLWQMLVNAF